MASVQGDQSVLTLDQLMEHEEAVIVAEINDKPVIFKLSELLNKAFLKELVGNFANALNMKNSAIGKVGALAMSTTQGQDQDISGFTEYGWIVGAISGNKTPAISVGTDVYGEPQRLIAQMAINGVPSFAPAFIGQIVVNNSKDIYMAAGVTAADWKKISA